MFHNENFLIQRKQNISENIRNNKLREIQDNLLTKGKYWKSISNRVQKLRIEKIPQLFIYKEIFL
jgi:hypothetical protein